MPHLCPVCGYPDLLEPPRTRSGGGSYEICPSCGFQFGVTDDDAGRRYDEWREAWRRRGMPWSSRAFAPPPGWNAEAQLGALSARTSRSKAQRKIRP